MNSLSRDSEFDLIVCIANNLKDEYIREGVADPWAGSPFAWIRSGPSSRQKGAIGEKLIAEWCAAKGLDAIKSKHSDADRIIGGRKMEIKFSTLWKDGKYVFQQIRDQDYEYAIFLGISPNGAHCWVIPKDVLMENFRGQHTGRAGKDTSWFAFPPDHPLAWLSGHGGSLSQAFQILERVAIQNS